MADTLVSHVIEVKAALKSQLAAAAEVIRGKMESHAKQHISTNVYDRPESWYRRTGLLRNSITTKVTENEDGSVDIAVGTDVEYAPYVELGTGIYAGKDSKAKSIPWHFMGSDGKWHTTSGVRARPFLRPAVESHTEEYKNALKRALNTTAEDG